jgi:hypothetical protein
MTPFSSYTHVLHQKPGLVDDAFRRFLTPHVDDAFALSTTRGGGRRYGSNILQNQSFMLLNFEVQIGIEGLWEYNVIVHFCFNLFPWTPSLFADLEVSLLSNAKLAFYGSQYMCSLCVADTSLLTTSPLFDAAFQHFFNSIV